MQYFMQKSFIGWHSACQLNAIPQVTITSLAEEATVWFKHSSCSNGSTPISTSPASRDCVAIVISSPKARNLFLRMQLKMQNLSLRLR
jgi:hypothetical protein